MVVKESIPCSVQDSNEAFTQTVSNILLKMQQSFRLQSPSHKRDYPAHYRYGTLFADSVRPKRINYSTVLYSKCCSKFIVTHIFKFIK